MSEAKAEALASKADVQEVSRMLADQLQRLRAQQRADVDDIRVQILLRAVGAVVLQILALIVAAAVLLIFRH